MYDRLKVKPLVLLVSALIIVVGINPSQAQAGCYNWDDPQSLGYLISCILGDNQGNSPLLHTIQVILIAITIGITVFTIYKTVTIWGSGNSQKMQELPNRIVYTLILILVVAGAGTAVLNLFLKLIGVGDLTYWIARFNESLSILDQLTQGIY